MDRTGCSELHKQFVREASEAFGVEVLFLGDSILETLCAEKFRTGTVRGILPQFDDG